MRDCLSIYPKLKKASLPALPLLNAQHVLPGPSKPPRASSIGFVGVRARCFEYRRTGMGNPFFCQSQIALELFLGIVPL